MKKIHIFLLLIFTACVPTQIGHSPSEYRDHMIYPYTVRKITLADQMKIAYVDEGSGPWTLLFVHGLGGYHQAWKKNIDGLRNKYRCIALDLPGNGLSSKGNHTLNLQIYSEIVTEFISKLKLKNVVLVGHSMGGQIVAKTTLKKLSDVKKLILIAPSGLNIFNNLERKLLLKVVEPKQIKNRSDWLIKQIFDNSYASGKLPTDAQFMLDYRLNLKNRPDNYFDYFCNIIYSLNKSIIDEPIINQLPSISIPTLVLWGKEDSQANSSLAQESKKRLPNCEVQLFSPCGHMLVWECAEKVNERIIDFLN